MSKAEIKIDGLPVALKKLSLEKWDLVVVKSPHPPSMMELEQLSEALPHHNTILCLRPGDCIEALPTEDMERLGWVRSDPG